MSSSSLFSYQPGELSLLLNPTSTPDVYSAPAPRAASNSKRALPDAETHKAQPRQQRPSKRAKTTSHSDTPHSSSPTPTPSTNNKQPNTDKHEAVDDGAADGDEQEQDEEVEGKDSQGAADEDVGDDSEFDEEEADGEEGEEELSDLDEELDRSALYDDMDASTERQLKREKRLRDDEESERLSTPAAKRRPNATSYDPAADPRLPRTLFVGNVPVSCTRKALMRRFAEYGGIESVRFRSFAVDNPKLPKKAAIIRHALHPQRTSMNAYVVFEVEEAVTRAVTANGSTFMDHTLRVDYADKARAAAASSSSSTPSLSHPRRTLFVGNVPFSTSDQALHALFSAAGAVSYVRLIRDQLMNVGKGFGFVVFEDEAAVKRALAMQGVAMEGRVLRLSRGLDEERLQKMREAREKERLKEQGLEGAARRVAVKEKHAKRKAEAASKAGKPPQQKPVGARASYGGERSHPEEWVRQQRRLDKKQKQRKEERKKRHSLVRTKPSAPLARGDGGAQTKTTTTSAKAKSK